MENLQRRFTALGSDVALTLVSADGAAADKMFDRLEDATRAFEARFSRFLPDSELTRVNQQAGSRTKVSQAFINLTNAAIEMAEVSDGLYNPFILPALQRAGYVGSWTPLDHELTATYETRHAASVDQITVGDGWIKLPADTALDFGGIGKGYLLARLAEVTEPNFASFWLSLGGDIVLNGHDASGKPWDIGVQYATDPSRLAGSFANRDGGRAAVATSGVTKRQGKRDGKPWHHIIDPRTGQPASTDLLTVSVVGDDIVLADVMAKSAVICGSKSAWKFLNERNIRGAILQQMGDNGVVKITRHETMAK